MINKTQSFARDQRGAVGVFVAIGLVAFLGMAALVVDIGVAFSAQKKLQAATNAAALAGAQVIGTGGNASNAATSYSGLPGNQNALSGLSGVTITTNLVCFTGAGFPPCTTIQTPATSANGIEVVETATVPTFLAKLFGVNSLTLSAGANAIAKGNGLQKPVNVAFILDTTASMNNSPQGPAKNACVGYSSALNCALSGIQALLGLSTTGAPQGLWPCAGNLANCGTVTNGNVANPVDEAALFVFPPLASASQTVYDYNCSGTDPLIASSYSASGAVYEIIPLSSDFRTSDNATTLNSTSDIVKAAGGASGCPAVRAKGGLSTYYAGAITAAQNYLAANSRPGVQNMIILLTDADANANAAKMGTGLPATNECKAAVAAAQAAAKAGISVYAVYYDDNSGSTCSTDSAPYNNACYTMQQVANVPSTNANGYVNDPTKFFSTDGSAAPCASVNPYTTLAQIFGPAGIGGSLSVARLISLYAGSSGTM
jgi:Flp pilus assembly protein TadG